MLLMETGSQEWRRLKITGWDLFNTPQPAELVASLCYTHFFIFFFVDCGIPQRQFSQKGSESVLNAMVSSKYGYEGVETKEGGRKRNAVCKDHGRHFISYILSTQLSDLGWLGNQRPVFFGRVTTEPNQNISPNRQ